MRSGSPAWVSAGDTADQRRTLRLDRDFPSFRLVLKTALAVDRYKPPGPTVRTFLSVTALSVLLFGLGRSNKCGELTGHNRNAERQRKRTTITNTCGLRNLGLLPHGCSMISLSRTLLHTVYREAPAQGTSPMHMWTVPRTLMHPSRVRIFCLY